MNVFKKLKDVLFDIEEEEIPVITKEDKVVKEEVNPIKEVKMPKEDDIYDEIVPLKRSNFEEEKPKKESNFNFPMDFDEELPRRNTKDYFDEDFTSNIITRETRVKETLDTRKNDYDYSRISTVKETKRDDAKPFRPSPVISPVYGILDQNYTKDDVIVKSEKKDLNLDDVRKKAYGTKKKEDKLEESLKTIDDILIENDAPEEIPKVKEERVLKMEDPIGVYDDELPDEPYADEVVESPKEEELESDLFNLIDSMYEERNERGSEE